jgi:hypothetical protein
MGGGQLRTAGRLSGREVVERSRAAMAEITAFWLKTSVMLRPLTELLSIRHITSLEFDTAGSGIMSRSRQVNVHLCRTVNSLPYSLHS